VRADLAERAKDDGVLEIAEILKPEKKVDTAGLGAGVDAGVPAGVGAPETAATGDGAPGPRSGEPAPQLEEALRVLADLVVLQTREVGAAR
jgi:hypothetical protein